MPTVKKPTKDACCQDILNDLEFRSYFWYDNPTFLYVAQHVSNKDIANRMNQGKTDPKEIMHRSNVPHRLEQYLKLLEPKVKFTLEQLKSLHDDARRRNNVVVTATRRRSSTKIPVIKASSVGRNRTSGLGGVDSTLTGGPAVIEIDDSPIPFPLASDTNVANQNFVSEDGDLAIFDRYYMCSFDDSQGSKASQSLLPGRRFPFGGAEGFQEVSSQPAGTMSSGTRVNIYERSTAQATWDGVGLFAEYFQPSREEHPSEFSFGPESGGVSHLQSGPDAYSLSPTQQGDVQASNVTFAAQIDRSIAVDTSIGSVPSSRSENSSLEEDIDAWMATLFLANYHGSRSVSSQHPQSAVDNATSTFRISVGQPIYNNTYMVPTAAFLTPTQHDNSRPSNTFAASEQVGVTDFMGSGGAPMQGSGSLAIGGNAHTSLTASTSAVEIAWLLQQLQSSVTKYHDLRVRHQNLMARYHDLVAENNSLDAVVNMLRTRNGFVVHQLVRRLQEGASIETILQEYAEDPKPFLRQQRTSREPR
ncbi:hypothetical protein H2203_008578 [Taxawa tesnikishii (nom. ined.)]|nr:hypothetical protein H2203_008578 [Dothideales sp. JES 119]